MSNDIVLKDNNIDWLKEFEEAIKAKRKRVSSRKTPPRFIKKKVGYDYVEKSKMKQALDEEYPIWSWLPAGTTPIIQIANWLIVCGQLEIVDNGAKRTFFSPGAAQIQIKQGGDYQNWRDILSVSNTVKSANIDGFKKAIAELTGLFSDVYKSAPDELIDDEQKTKLLAMIEKANKINQQYSLENISNKFGKPDDMTVADYKKIMDILTRVINQ
jgi:hypothetical protein